MKPCMLTNNLSYCNLVQRYTTQSLKQCNYSTEKDLRDPLLDDVNLDKEDYKKKQEIVPLPS